MTYSIVITFIQNVERLSKIVDYRKNGQEKKKTDIC